MRFHGHENVNSIIIKITTFCKAIKIMIPIFWKTKGTSMP